MKQNCKIFQIYYNDESKAKILDGFIPYDNSNSTDPYFENTVILDIWKNKQDVWRNADYVGVVSWRFYEKTGLTYDDILEKIGGRNDVYLMTPQKYLGMHSSLSSNGFGTVPELAKIIDEDRIFPFDLYDFDVKYHNTECVSFCNFFLVKPYIFDDYCTRYLNKMVTYLETSDNVLLRRELSEKCRHRDNKMYPIQPFLLEGLFQCYIHYDKIDFDYILKTQMTFSDYRKSKRSNQDENKEFRSLLMGA